MKEKQLWQVTYMFIAPGEGESLLFVWFYIIIATNMQNHNKMIVFLLWSLAF